VSKYGKFGLAFNKEFLIQKGASPVLYVANDSPVPATEIFCPDDFKDRINEARKAGQLNRALYFDASVRGLLDILAAVDAICCNEHQRYIKGISVEECKTRLGVLLSLPRTQIDAAEAIVTGNVQAIKTVRMCLDFLINYVFTNIKCFDAKRSFHDAENYYMEREWRIGNNVEFTIDDVARVFFPPTYAKRFRADMPTYTGQLTFIE
jgi:hypothetical protein